MSIAYSKEFNFSTEEIIIKKERILKFLQVPSHGNEPYFDNLISELQQQALEISAPKGAYTIFDSPEFDNHTSIIIKRESDVF